MRTVVPRSFVGHYELNRCDAYEVFTQRYPGGAPRRGVLPYQSGGGVPPEPMEHMEREREKSRNLWSPRENYLTIDLISISVR